MQKEHLNDVFIKADDPGVEPEDTQCCRKRRNGKARVSSREHGEELEHGLLETDISHHHKVGSAVAQQAKHMRQQKWMENQTGKASSPGIPVKKKTVDVESGKVWWSVGSS